MTLFSNRSKNHWITTNCATRRESTTRKREGTNYVRLVRVQNVVLSTKKIVYKQFQVILGDGRLGLPGNKYRRMTHMLFAPTPSPGPHGYIIYHQINRQTTGASLMYVVS